jgi:quinol monooxygenase YgiN
VRLDGNIKYENVIDVEFVDDHEAIIVVSSYAESASGKEHLKDKSLVW